MVDSYNCLRLDNGYVFLVEVYIDNDNKKFLEIVDFDEDKLKPNSTEEDIEKLGGRIMKRQSKFINYVNDGYKPDQEDNINIIAVIATTTELGKRYRTEVGESPESKKKKWDTNGVIRIIQREYVYFVNPLPLSESLIEKIRSGDFTAIHGARASGKSTRVLSVIERLESKGFSCIYVTLEAVNVDSKELFWISFGNSIIRNGHHLIKNRTIKTDSDFHDMFSINKWEAKKTNVVIFVDEYDKLERANDDIKASFLETVRAIKTTKEDYVIWSINAIGPFSILHLNSKKVTTSPFNVRDPYHNPNFTREQVQDLYEKFQKHERINIDQEIINDIHMRTNGHAGLVCLCGKAIETDLLKYLDENSRLNFSVWLKYTAKNSLEAIILGYPTFKKLIDTLETLEKAKPAVDMLRHSFVGFLGFVMIFDSQELKLAEFLSVNSGF
ncbi:hypothetical protein RclHR1_04630012 [Rhizophagus clarus]|uniref:ATPase AAA-type core domain-containing protein n=1 Tax=Rhizophagus clarus TaxID=94130 RepID=A0A2Z6RIM1_9GLOM|nr:hypothetical protein RclHR1_04630012 [Rhizophagus clarus]